MRKVIGPILLLTVACGEDPGAGDNRLTREIPAGALERVVVTAPSGSFELSTGETSQVVIRSPMEVDATVAGQVLRIRNQAGGRLTLVAPPGLDLAANLKAGEITVTGTWGFVDLDVAKGKVTVHAAALAGGNLDTLRGDIACMVGSAPTRNLKCTAAIGDVEITIPASFRGAVQLVSDKGEIDAPRTGLQLHRDLSGKTVQAFVGEHFTVRENAEFPVDKRPGVWARANRGKVKFRLGGS